MGNATPMDVVVLMVLGSLLSRGINGSASLASTMIASAVLVACHWLLTWATVRYHAIGSLAKGYARVLVADGKVDEEALRKSHISRADLEEGMRLNGNIEDPALRIESTRSEAARLAWSDGPRRPRGESGLQARALSWTKTRRTSKAQPPGGPCGARFART